MPPFSPPFILPTQTTAPDPLDGEGYPVYEDGRRIPGERPRMGIEASGVMLASLKQTRQFYLSRLFPVFQSNLQPVNPALSPYQIYPLGRGTLEIGPCEFHEADFYQVRYHHDCPSPPLGLDPMHGQEGEMRDDEFGWLDLEGNSLSHAIAAVKQEQGQAQEAHWADMSVDQVEHVIGENTGSGQVPLDPSPGLLSVKPKLGSTGCSRSRSPLSALIKVPSPVPPVTPDVPAGPSIKPTPVPSPALSPKTASPSISEPNAPSPMQSSPGLHPSSIVPEQELEQEQEAPCSSQPSLFKTASSALTFGTFGSATTRAKKISGIGWEFGLGTDEVKEEEKDDKEDDGKGDDYNDEKEDKKEEDKEEEQNDLDVLRLRGGEGDEIDRPSSQPSPPRASASASSSTSSSDHGRPKPNGPVLTPKLQSAAWLAASTDARLAKLLNMVAAHEVTEDEEREFCHLMWEVKSRMSRGEFNKVADDEGRKVEEGTGELGSIPITSQSASLLHPLIAGLGLPSVGQTGDVASLGKAPLPLPKSPSARDLSPPPESGVKPEFTTPILDSDSHKLSGHPRSTPPRSYHKPELSDLLAFVDPLPDRTTETPSRTQSNSGLPSFSPVTNLDLNTSYLDSPSMNGGVMINSFSSPQKSPPPLPLVPPANDVLVCFHENPDVFFLLPLSRSMVIKSPVEQEDALKMSFFVPTPNTVFPPIPYHLRFNNGWDETDGEDRERNLLSVVINQFEKAVGEAVEKSYLGHLAVIFQGMNGEKERIREFDAQIQRGLPPRSYLQLRLTSPVSFKPVDLPVRKSINTGLCSQRSLEQEQAQKRQEQEHRKIQEEFFRQDRARVHFERYGRWPEGYEPPVVPQQEYEDSKVEEKLEVEEEVLGFKDKGKGKAKAQLGSRLPVKKPVGRPRKSKEKRKGKGIAVSSDEEEACPVEMVESSEGHSDGPLRDVPRSRPQRKTQSRNWAAEMGIVDMDDSSSDSAPPELPRPKPKKGTVPSSQVIELDGDRSHSPPPRPPKSKKKVSVESDEDRSDTPPSKPPRPKPKRRTMPSNGAVGLEKAPPTPPISVGSSSDDDDERVSRKKAPTLATSSSPGFPVSSSTLASTSASVLKRAQAAPKPKAKRVSVVLPPRSPSPPPVYAVSRVSGRKIKPSWKLVEAHVSSVGELFKKKIYASPKKSSLRQANSPAPSEARSSTSAHPRATPSEVIDLVDASQSPPPSSVASSSKRPAPPADSPSHSQPSKRQKTAEGFTPRPRGRPRESLPDPAPGPSEPSIPQPRGRPRKTLPTPGLTRITVKPLTNPAPGSTPKPRGRPRLSAKPSAESGPSGSTSTSLSRNTSGTTNVGSVGYQGNRKRKRKDESSSEEELLIMSVPGANMTGSPEL